VRTEARNDAEEGEQGEGEHPVAARREHGVPRVELFARGVPPTTLAGSAGWVALGNEVDGLDIRVALRVVQCAQLGLEPIFIETGEAQ